MPKRKNPTTQAAPLKAQGKDKKRTPQSAFDPAAGKDVYEPEKILAERIVKGGATQYQVKWAGYEAKHNTWEPIENLAGCEDMIADFKQHEKQRLAEIEAAAEAKRIEKQEAAAEKAAEEAAAKAAARIEQAAASPVQDDMCTPGVHVRVHDNRTVTKELGSRRTSPIWEAFDTNACPSGYAACKLVTAMGSVCDEMICCKSGPTGLWNHAMYHHKADYVRLKPSTEPLNLTCDPQTKLAALAPKHRDAIHKAIARWLVKRKRPLRLPEDPEFHDVFKVAMQGSYTPPDHKIVLSNVLLLAGEGKQFLFDVNKSLRSDGIKPAMAGDIWSDHGISLFGLVQYHITDDWEIKELLLGAKPFSSERHTAEAIRTITSECCVEAGLSADVRSTVFFPVSDNAANMIAGWSTFGRGPCAVHTGQLSVHVFLDHPRIAPTRTKQRGITSHFSKSTGVDGLGALKKCQRDCNLPDHFPVKDNDTRWSGGHDQMEWFRQQQRAVQLYDVNHARSAGDAYREHQLGLEDWRITTEGVAVLQPVADWTQHMQGTKSYPTLPLVLPTVYGLIEGMGPEAALSLSFLGQDPYELEPKEMHDGVLQARTEMHSDWVSRWITNINPHAKRIYAIAALLHPAFKTYEFIEGFELVPSTDKAWALSELRHEWLTVWKPRRSDPSSSTADAAVPAAAPEPEVNPTKKRKVTLGSLLAARVKKEMSCATPHVVAQDELDQYLADPEEVELDVKLLKWWQAKWPNLCKMVKQYLASPASSAGVERVFSAAGKMHGDLSKSVSAETIEYSLFAAINAP